MAGGLAAALLSAVPAPALAGTSNSGPATLTAKGGFVAPGACQEGPPAYRLVVDESEVDSFDDWSADITITGPGGYYETDFLWDEEGWNRAWFCKPRNRPGTYTVTADLEIDHWSDDDYWTTYKTLSTTFKVTGLASSAVRYVKKPYKAHGWKFPVKVTRAGKAWPRKSVAMQFKVCGSWNKLLAKKTNRSGRVTFYTSPERGWNRSRTCGVRHTKIRFRFYASGNYKTKASSSGLFRITRRS